MDTFALWQKVRKLAPKSHCAPLLPSADWNRKTVVLRILLVTVVKGYIYLQLLNSHIEIGLKHIIEELVKSNYCFWLWCAITIFLQAQEHHFCPVFWLVESKIDTCWGDRDLSFLASVETCSWEVLRGLAIPAVRSCSSNLCCCGSLSCGVWEPPK